MNNDITLALAALQAVLGLIGSIKAQHGLTDDAILAQAKQLTADDDAAYAALVKALTTTPAPVALVAAAPVAPIVQPPTAS